MFWENWKSKAGVMSWRCIPDPGTYDAEGTLFQLVNLSENSKQEDLQGIRIKKVKHEIELRPLRIAKQTYLGGDLEN